MVGVIYYRIVGLYMVRQVWTQLNHYYLTGKHQREGIFEWVEGWHIIPLIRSFGEVRDCPSVHTNMDDCLHQLNMLESLKRFIKNTSDVIRESACAFTSTFTSTSNALWLFVLYGLDLNERWTYIYCQPIYSNTYIHVHYSNICIHIQSQSMFHTQTVVSGEWCDLIHHRQTWPVH